MKDIDFFIIADEFTLIAKLSIHNKICKQIFRCLLLGDDFNLYISL